MAKSRLETRHVPALAADSKLTTDLHALATSSFPVRPPRQVKRRAGANAPEDVAATRIRRNSPTSPKKAAHLNPARAAAQRTVKRLSPPLSKTGRQFTVGNVGNNGLIYLRPVIRPGNLRSPPTSPHAAAPLPGLHIDETNRKSLRPASSIFPESTYSSTISPPKTAQERQQKGAEIPRHRSPVRSPPRPTPQARPHSFSTIGESSQKAGNLTEDPGTFRVVIQRSSQAPKGAKKESKPAVAVPIPGHRLGTPQFGPHGSVQLRSSVYTKSSHKDGSRLPHISQAGVGGMSILYSSEFSHTISEPFPPTIDDPDELDEVQDVYLPVPETGPSGAMMAPLDPRVFDTLVLNPDDPRVVRYSPGSKDIIAATPARLIAHITSPNFLDYELLSDFFLTFRGFMRAHDLVSYLMVRLRWAVERPDDFGRIARVRTFVALRHWILNYFLDDFISDLDLRFHLCDSVNELYDYLSSRNDGGGGDLKILGELKKCWRRTAGLHWTDVEIAGQTNSDDKITPGGHTSTTSPHSGSLLVPRPPDFETSSPLSGTALTSPVTDELALHKEMEAVQLNVQHAQPPVLSAVFEQTVPLSPISPDLERGAPLSPVSSESIRVLSCSIPYKPIYRHEPGTDVPLFPHPVQHAVLTVTPSPSTVKAPNSELRHHQDGFAGEHDDEVAFAINPPTKEPRMRIPTMLVVPGCLVRGALYEPTAPYLDIKPPTVKPKKSERDLHGSESSVRAPNSPNPGVRRLIGSVRKALGSRHNVSDGARGISDLERVPENEKGYEEAASMDSPTPGQQARAARGQVRIDILAARVLESFKDAVAQLEEQRSVMRQSALMQSSQMDRFLAPNVGGLLPAFMSDRDGRSMTVGSRSIVIVDDTGEDHMMSGAIHPPSETFYSSFHSIADRNSAELDSSMSVSRASRPRVASIDSVMAEQKIHISSLHVPRVYMPTGFRKSITGQIEESRPSQKFRNSMRSEASARSTPRKYASYHSGTNLSSQRSLHRSGSGTSGTELFSSDKQPTRPLRRRPGGDLKAVSKVVDLEHRPMSSGSLSEASRSLMTSLATSPLASPVKERLRTGEVASPTRSKQPSVANKAEEELSPRGRKSISLIQTHSSQPNLRPSFEAEVAKLAALPDDVDDDGGIEAALLKLEGKYEKKTPATSPVKSEFEQEVQDWMPGEDEEERKERHHHDHVEDIHPVAPLQALDASTPAADDVIDVNPSERESIHTVGERRLSAESLTSVPTTVHTHRKQPSQSVLSDDSYSSVPILERGLSSPRANPKTGTKRMQTPPVDEVIVRAPLKAPHTSLSSSIAQVEKRDEVKELPRRKPSVAPSKMNESFLLDDKESLSDEPLDDDTENWQDTEDFDDDDDYPTDDKMFDDDDLRTEHRGWEDSFTKPYASSDVNTSPTSYNNGLPTPGLTPTPGPKTPTPGQRAQAAVAAPQPTIARAPSPGGPQLPAQPSIRLSHKTSSIAAQSAPHLPFILAYDAQLLARQFTLIEKDALDEIDWRELIELRWKQTSPPVRDWVEYLLTAEPRGVDLVIARFNLVVKWTKSQIVLCEALDERVRTVTQLIRIAEACRKLGNYATMYQITVALLSTDCARLKRTWSLVPVAETEMLRGLEQVVQPVRNFQNLRKEMEIPLANAQSGGEGGCIPFIGIYTRDLIYNAQKPPLITSPPPINPSDPLINFERHKSAAAIVKSLLRLLEAAGKYSFPVEPIVASRCLWLGCLGEEEIFARAKRLD